MIYTLIDLISIYVYIYKNDINLQFLYVSILS